MPGRDAMAQYIAERVRRGLGLRVLRSPQRETADIWPTSSEELRELRHAPPGIDLGMTMYIHDDKVTYLSSKRENHALVIESRDLAALNRAMFEGLWLTSEAARPRKSRKRG